VSGRAVNTPMQPSTVLALLFGAVFLSWLGLTIAFQFRRWQVSMRFRDPLYMLPSWSFFAPVPNTSDFVFVCRYESHGELTPWKQPGLLSAKAFPLLWDPERRQKKAIIDIGQSLAEFVKDELPDMVHLTTPYLLLLQYASSQPEAMFATGVQVAIGVRPERHDDFQLFFQSHLHPLEPAISGIAATRP
jgi:hypothetical protein